MRKILTYNDLLLAKNRFDLAKIESQNYTDIIKKVKEGLIKKVVSKFIGRDCVDSDAMNVSLVIKEGYPNEQILFYLKEELGVIKFIYGSDSFLTLGITFTPTNIFFYE